MPIVDKYDVKLGAEEKKNLVHMSGCYNLRFGCCLNSEGDFIDTITGTLNIYVAHKCL